MKFGFRLTLLPAVTALFVLGCSRQLPEVAFERVSYPGDTAAPILFIGLDGLEWDVVLPLLERGDMPVLMGLMKRGSYGLLKTWRPTSSPIIWTTIATGRTGRAHGVRGFVKEQATETRELYTNSDRTTKALWNILTDYHKRVATGGWWMTYPVERINGVMIAQTNTTKSGP
jgi:predicted AlkP superfamily phosphohydrolase/phosphomutase